MFLFEFYCDLMKSMKSCSDSDTILLECFHKVRKCVGDSSQVPNPGKVPKCGTRSPLTPPSEHLLSYNCDEKMVMEIRLMMIVTMTKIMVIWWRQWWWSSVVRDHPWPLRVHTCCLKRTPEAEQFLPTMFIIDFFQPRHEKNKRTDTVNRIQAIPPTN